MSIRKDLDAIIHAAKLSAVQENRLGALQESSLVPAGTGQPKSPEHGDLASGVALKLASAAKMPPIKIAEEIASFVRKDPRVSEQTLSKIAVAPPGFINFEVGPKWLCSALLDIHKQGANFGRIDLGRGKKILIEYVSANPTGDLHIGHGRNAVFGSCLANLFKFASFDVKEEFYINDAGEQIAQLDACAWALYQRRLGKEVAYPETGYPEANLLEYLDQIVAHDKDTYLSLPDEQGKKKLGALLREAIITRQKELLDKLQVHFDTWFSERSLHESTKVEAALRRLGENGYTYESEGALWLKAKELGDERDRVLRKSDGNTTYLANDAAYHLDKFERGFDLLINIWGADHHGQVPGLKAIVKALGKNPDQLEVVLTHIVNLVRDGQIVRMSKRRGTFVTLAEVTEEVGVDAVRYYLAESNPQNPINFDLELAKKTSRENPAFYIQYAHARCCAILRRALEPIVDTENQKTEKPLLSAEQWQHYSEEYRHSESVFLPGFDANAQVFAHQKALVISLQSLPDEVEEAVKSQQPGRLARFAFDVANHLQKYYEVSRVITDDPAVTKARLGLIAATKQVLANVLVTIGVWSQSECNSDIFFGTKLPRPMHDPASKRMLVKWAEFKGLSIHMDDKFSLKLSQEEGILLLTSARLLDKLVAGVTIHARERDELIREIIEKLSLSLSPQLASMSEELANAIVESVLGLDEEHDEEVGVKEFIESSPDSTILNFPMYAIELTLPILEKAVIEHHSVRAQYYSFARESVDNLTLNPLSINREDNLWRMIAYCHELDEVLVFRVDRIKELAKTAKRFELPQNFNAERQTTFASYC